MPSARVPTPHATGRQIIAGDEAHLESACRKGAALLALLVFLAYLPALPSLSHWRGDERFYTDAAVAMKRSGHYFTPAYPDGSLRFKKPILPYWAVVAGFDAFGFNYLGSRIASLAAGSLVVWLSFELCQALTRRSRVSLVATAILASNLTVHNTSIRSTPDMLLCVFLLTSLIGFTKLIFQGPSFRWHMLAYLGGGLAMAAKGLSGLLPAVYAFLYVCLARRTPIKLCNLFHPIFTPLGLLLGVAWFAWAFSRYGMLAAADFFGDQIGERFSGSKLYILKNALAYLGSFIVELLPWSALSLAVFIRKRREAVEVFRENRERMLFAAGWILILFLVFTGGNIQRTRYFLPAYPFLAVFYAVPLVLAANSPGIDAARKCFFGMGIFLGLALAVLGGGIAQSLLIAGVLLAGSATLLWWLSNRWSPIVRIATLAAYLVLVFSISLVLITPTFRFSAAPDIIRTFSDIGEARTLPMSGIDVMEAAQIRVLSKGQLNPFIIPPAECQAVLGTNGFVICSERVLKACQPQNATAEEICRSSTPWKLRDYMALFRSSDPRAFLRSKQVPYYLVTRRVAVGADNR